MLQAAVLEQIAFARRIADHADRLGIQCSPTTPRSIGNHIGAVLADAVLQAGVNYRTVVRGRIERIHSQFPEAATLTGLMNLIERGEASNFLLWNHFTKVIRFVTLAQFLALRHIETTIDLKAWLCKSIARDHLLGLHGIGPKTYDYLCCLVGIDCIAVDRHIKTFANEAGVPLTDYDGLKSAFSFAADFLGIARRDFDAWIWRTVSARDLDTHQLSLM